MKRLLSLVVVFGILFSGSVYGVVIDNEIPEAYQIRATGDVQLAYLNDISDNMGIQSYSNVRNGKTVDCQYDSYNSRLSEGIVKAIGVYASTRDSYTWLICSYYTGDYSVAAPGADNSPIGLRKIGRVPEGVAAYWKVRLEKSDPYYIANANAAIRYN